MWANQSIFTVIGFSPVNSVFNHPNYIGISKCGICFMTWLKIENLTVSPMITTAGPEHLTALKRTDKYKFIRLGYSKRLTISFLVIQFDEWLIPCAIGCDGSQTQTNSQSPFSRQLRLQEVPINSFKGFEWWLECRKIAPIHYTKHHIF